MAERLTIAYDIDPTRIGTQIGCLLGDTQFLYGNGWQEGNFWRGQNHLDRLKVECLIDKDLFPMSVVHSEDDRYNVLLHAPLTPDSYQSPLSKLYIGVIDRPEHDALSLAQLGNVDRLLEGTRAQRGILTDEDIDYLETWSRIQLIKDRSAYLRKMQPNYRQSHRTIVEQWEEEVRANRTWLSDHEVDINYNSGETLYKDILARVIDDIIIGKFDKWP